MERVNPIKTVLKMLGMVVGASIIGLVLMWFVYLLPVEPMAEHILDSYETIREQDTWDDDYLAALEWAEILDTGTNIIMFHEVIYPNTGNAFEDSLLAPGGDVWFDMIGDWTAGLMDFAEDREYTDNNSITYARYWHGYLIFLKPLFLLMELDGIYIINTIALLILRIAVLYLLYKRIGMYSIAYLVALLTMHPENIVVSFQLSSIFYALNITLLLLLWKKDWAKEQVLYLFLFDGILVAFFDFLTYPYVAVAIPLLVYYLMHKENDIKKDFITMFTQGLSFIFGYAGMWAMKWIYATLFTSENVIIDAINSVLHRTGVTDSNADVMSSGVGESLYRNVYTFFDDGNILVLVAAIVVAGVTLWIKRKSVAVSKEMCVFCGLMVLSPFVWLIVLSNHCSLHPHLEWRTLCIVVFALAVFVISILPYAKQLEDK
ncbi:MAG: hypothetical protein IJE49_10325 [Agathobacter sp.]|nr:hypothetical protein [Agathobacter sp.]